MNLTSVQSEWVTWTQKGLFSGVEVWVAGASLAMLSGKYRLPWEEPSLRVRTLKSGDVMERSLGLSAADA